VSSGQRGGGDASGARKEISVRLLPVVTDAVSVLGFELEQLDVRQAGRRLLVKAVVDGEQGVGLDEVADVSRAVSVALDAHDHLLCGPYTLEVTSPGIDRPLTAPRHWRRARFRLVRVRQSDGAEFVGRVGGVTDEMVQLLVDGRLRELPYGIVERAVVEVEFRPPPVDELALLEHGGQEEPT